MGAIRKRVIVRRVMRVIPIHVKQVLEQEEEILVAVRGVGLETGVQYSRHLALLVLLFMVLLVTALRWGWMS